MIDRFIPAHNPSTKILYSADHAAGRRSFALTANQLVRWQHVVTWRGITENATLLRVVADEPDGIHVVPDITYRDIVGARYGMACADASYQALSVLAILQTSDGHIILCPRDSGDWPASYEAPGGFVRAASQWQTVDECIAERLAREVPALTIHRCQCAGVYDFPSIAEHMYVYDAYVSQTAHAVRRRMPEAQVLSQMQLTALLAGTLTVPAPLHFPTARVLQARFKIPVPVPLKETAHCDVPVYV